jgi:hypothetical protein
LIDGIVRTVFVTVFVTVAVVVVSDSPTKVVAGKLDHFRQL